MKTKTLLTVGAVAVLGVLAYSYYKKKNWIIMILKKI